MNRREVFPVLAAGLVAVPAMVTAAPTDSDVMLVRVVVPKGAALCRGRVICCRTGADVSGQFPIQVAQRLRRSFETKRPIKVSLYRLRDGHVFVEGGRVAREMKTVRLTAITEA